MSELSDKYYTCEQIKEIAIQKHIPEEYHEDFCKKFEKEVEILTNEDGFTKSEIGEAALNFSRVYIEKLQGEIQKGHSREWSELYAENMEMHMHAFCDTYLTIKEIDPALALRELKIHCKSLEVDDLYEKYFIYLMDHGEGCNKPDIQASNYSKIYKEQITLGKSSVFAHEYAALMAVEEYREAYCFAFAKFYEEEIVNGKPESYAKRYAYEIAEYYANKYINGKEIKYDDYDKLTEAKIKKNLDENKNA